MLTTGHRPLATDYSNCFPFVSGNCVAIAHASRNDPATQIESPTQPFVCATRPITKGAIELIVRAPL